MTDNQSTSPAPSAQRAYLTEPLPDLVAWTRYFRESEIPVLHETAVAIEALREKENDVSPGELGEVIDADPLMTIKFMAHVAGKRRSGSSTETETVTSSLVLNGILPFFRSFGPQPTIEDRLADQPEALAALQELLMRGRRAGHFALAFAVHRGDTDAAVIHQAAFLHDFADMLMWCHAPTLQLKIREAQLADSTLRSAVIQTAVLNIDMADLRQELLRIWRLPELLVRISDGKHPHHPNVLNVTLASRLARHTMRGWDNAAIPDDVEDIARLLNATPRVALSFLKKVDLSD